MNIKVVLLFLISSFSGLIVAVSHKDNVYLVVLAGGTGERMWPLSREARPKQFIPISHGKTLLEVTFDRLSGVHGIKHNWVVTTEALEDMVAQTMGDNLERIIVEPSKRNTGPAILLTLQEIHAKDPHAYVIFLPADHHIPDTEALCSALNKALDNGDHRITLIGVKPTYPATGYGYIHASSVNYDEKQPVPIVGFVEKPIFEIAQEYCKNPNMLWNCGMFCGSVATFIEQYKKYSPELYDGMQAYLAGEKAYNDLENISVDYAVHEKSEDLAVLPVAFEWSDIGNLAVFLELYKQENPSQDGIIEVDADNNLIHSRKKVVALVDVHNLVIVETDDALLIISKDQSERVKRVVGELKKYEKYSSLL